MRGEQRTATNEAGHGATTSCAQMVAAKEKQTMILQSPMDEPLPAPVKDSLATNRERRKYTDAHVTTTGSIDSR